MLDLRYHLVSLVAVFLALAIGMLIGSSFLAGSSVDGLKREFAILRTENRVQQANVNGLQDQLKKHKEFERFSMPLLVNNQLQWRRVAIIQTGDYSGATQSAKAALDAAGAQVVSVTTLSDLSAPGAASRIRQALKQTSGAWNIADPPGTALSIIAKSVVGGETPEALDAFEKRGLLSKSGDYDLRLNKVVIVGGSKQSADGRPMRVDLPLIEKLSSLNVAVVGCEPMVAETSYVPSWHRKEIATVDNVDDPAGQTALVFAVAGDTGNFGVKASADRMTPEYLEKSLWRSERPR